MSQSTPATTATAAELPVRAVTLSNAGLVQIERAGDLQPDAAIAFRARASWVLITGTWYEFLQASHAAHLSTARPRLTTA